MAYEPYTLPGAEPLFDPNYLNLEYFFNLVFRIFDIFALLLGLVPGPFSPIFQTFFWFLVFAILAAIIYTFHEHRKIEHADEEKYSVAHFDALAKVDHKERNERWEKVLTLAESLTDSDWKLAIIEADAMLGILLQKMGHHHDSIGENLKAVEPSDFLTLDQAWEAHKIRNRIAHDGANFALSRREAERVVDLYRQVFKEFHYI